MSTPPAHQPGRFGGPANTVRQGSPPAAATPASGPSMLRVNRGQASHQPQHFYNVAGVNHSWQPQSRLYRPAAQAPNVVPNAHPPWTAGPAHAAAPLGAYPGVPGHVQVAAGLPWHAGAAPMSGPTMWPPAAGILNQPPDPPQQRGRCQEWAPIEVECLLTLKEQKGMTHPKIAQVLSQMFNVERTHHMVTKKLAALRREAIRPNVSIEVQLILRNSPQHGPPFDLPLPYPKPLIHSACALSCMPVVSAATLTMSWHSQLYDQAIRNVLPRAFDVLFEELATETGTPFSPSEQRKKDLERFLLTWFSWVIMDSQRAAGTAGTAGAAGARAMGSQEQAQF